MAQAQLITRATHGDSLADILERVLNTGVVIAGDIQIKLCDVELLSIQLRLVICSVEKARELGISWWWQTSGAAGIGPRRTRSSAARAHCRADIRCVGSGGIPAVPRFSAVPASDAGDRARAKVAGIHAEVMPAGGS